MKKIRLTRSTFIHSLTMNNSVFIRKYMFYQINEDKRYLPRNIYKFLTKLLPLFIVLISFIVIFYLSLLITNYIKKEQIKNNVERVDSNLRRVKREFMFASGQNSTDPECFQVSFLFGWICMT